MPVESTNSEYKVRIEQWSRCRSTVEGNDAVKAAGTKFLPKLEGMSETEYKAYSTRALFYGATGRTVQGLSGAVFRKSSILKYIDRYTSDLDVTTVDGLSFREVELEVIREELTVGRLGILVDPTDGEGVQSTRAYAALYYAENITNWRTAKINGVERLVLVVLKENTDDVDQDGFSTESSVEYRVLRLNNVEGDQVYSQEVWVKQHEGEGSDKFVRDPKRNAVPKRMGKVLDHIPFFFINTNSLTPKTDKPPLLDLVDVNLSHFRTSADLEHGAHFTALPTPWVAGFPADSVLKIGSGVAWVTDDVNAKAGMLEYTGQGLSALSGLKDGKESLMARLGAQLLEEQRSGVESAETHKIRQSGESGALLSMVVSVSEGLTNVLKEMAWWAGAQDTQLDKIEYSLNKDFISARMAPQEIIALMQSWQVSAISQDTFLYNMQQGEILPPDRTIEDEKDLIEVQAPSNDMGDEEITPIKKSFGIVRDEDGKATGISEQ